MPEYLKRLSLADLFDRSARLTGRVFGRGLMLGVVTMFPAGVVMGFAMREVFAALADTMQLMGNGILFGPNSAVLPMLFGGIEFFVGYIVFLFASIVLQAGIIFLVDAEIHGEPRTWQDAFAHGWHAAFKIFMQTVVIWIVAIALFGISVGLGAGLMHSFAASFFLIGAAVAAAFWIFVSWMFAAQTVVCEQCGIVLGLARSRLLVRGHWWRVLGVLVLFGLLTEFAVLIVTLPFQGMAFGSLYPRLFDVEREMLLNPDNPASMVEFLLRLSHIGWQLGLLQAVSAALMTIVSGVYITILYFDIRARHGEFDATSSEEIV